MNAWCNIDIATSVNMIAGTDSRRDSWTDADPLSSEAVRLLDELKAQIGITQGSQVHYDLAGIVGNLYSEPDDDEVSADGFFEQGGLTWTRRRCQRKIMTFRRNYMI